MTAPRTTPGRPSTAFFRMPLQAFPRNSSRMYLRLAPSDLSLLKFLLEAEDNLAYLSTVSPHTAVVRLVFAPGREREVGEFLDTVRPELEFQEVVTFQGGAGSRESREHTEVRDAK